MLLKHQELHLSIPFSFIKVRGGKLCQFIFPHYMT